MKNYYFKTLKTTVVLLLLTIIFSCSKDSNIDDDNGGSQSNPVTKTELTEKAIVLSKDEASTDIVKFNANSMIIKAKSAYGKYIGKSGKIIQSKPLEVGSIMTCEPTNIIPDGMLIEITSITASTDAQYGAGYNYLEFNNRNIESLIKNLPKTEDTKSLEARTIENEGGVTSKFNGNKINLEVSKNISVKEKIGNDSIQINGKLTGTVEFSKDYKFGLEINERKLQYFALAMTSNDNLNLKFEGAVTGKKTKEIKLCTVQGKPMIFQLGPVPVTVTPVFEVKIELEMSGKVDLKMTLVKYDKEYTQGVKYNNGTWSIIDYSLPKDDTNNDFSVGLQGKLKATLEAEFTGKFYGGLAYLGVYGNAFAEISDRANIGESLKADLTLGYALGVKTGIKLWSKTLSTEFTYEPVRGEYKKSIIDLIAGSLDIPKYGLVAYYPFNGNAYDESGNGNNGTVSSGAKLTIDRKGSGSTSGAYQFGGFNNPNYIKVSNSTSLKFQTAMSLSAFVKIKNTKAMDGYGSYVESGEHTIFSKQGDRGGQFSGTFSSSVAENTAQAWLPGLTNSCVSKINGTQLNQWVHVVYVITTTQTSIYMNGQLIKTDIGNVSFSSINSANLYFGRFGDANGWAPNGWYPLDGELDDIRIYNRSLTPSEIIALYNE